MNDVIDSFQKKVSNVEGLVRYTYGRQSGNYQEFYPQGVTEYSRMSVENADTLITRFFTALNLHSGDFPPSVITDFQTLQNDYQFARQTQLAEKGEVAGSRDAVNTAKLELQTQLMFNTLTIAAEFVVNPPKRLSILIKAY